MTILIEDMMQWQRFRANTPQDKTIGFVPTMGNLHRGHAALIKQSLNENNITVVSIYINPRQFNNREDLEHYPQTMNDDLALLKTLSVDICLHPKTCDMYPENYNCKVSENMLSTVMEGKYRPKHFDGMLTIVLKFLSLIKANRAYFGEKDYQQFLLVKKMARAFFLETAIIPCPTVRENTGLALSSRNHRLNKEQKQLAEQFALIFHQGRNIEEIKRQLRNLPLRIDYIEEAYQRRFAAVNIGNIRLIDNYALI